MTRINAGIPVTQLTNKHLIAEHREIKRIPNMISKGRYNMDGQPKHFTLGKGHVKFFYDKLTYLYKRYHQLYYECQKRGFKVTYYGNAWDGLPDSLRNDWEPTPRAIFLIKQRIKQKLNKPKT